MTENKGACYGRKLHRHQWQKDRVYLGTAQGAGIEPEKENPFEMVAEGERYYYITTWGGTMEANMSNGGSSYLRWNAANYCTDEPLLLQQAYRETLNRLLWRFSMENDGDKINPEEFYTCKYFIIWSHICNKWIVADVFKFTHPIGTVFFYTHSIAQRAIKEIVEPFMKSHPDFKL